VKHTVFLEGLNVLMAGGMKMAVFWVVAPSSLVEVYHCVNHKSCLVMALMLEAGSIFETQANIYHITWCCNLAGSQIHKVFLLHIHLQAFCVAISYNVLGHYFSLQ
jgi:hypothetical protein